MIGPSAFYNLLLLVAFKDGASQLVTRPMHSSHDEFAFHVTVKSSQ